MDVLVDTHAFLWFANGDSRLGSTAREVMEGGSNACFLSPASLWEMAIKVSLGKLKLSLSYDILVPAIMEANGFELLPISIAHTSKVAQMDFPRRDHRDPFDRLIIAQCLIEDLLLVSLDEKLDAYNIRRIW